MSIDDLLFTRYDSPQVSYGPWPSDGHPFWKFVEAEHEKMIARCRELFVEYFAACGMDVPETLEQVPAKR